MNIDTILSIISKISLNKLCISKQAYNNGNKYIYLLSKNEQKRLLVRHIEHNRISHLLIPILKISKIKYIHNRTIISYSILNGSPDIALFLINSQMINPIIGYENSLYYSCYRSGDVYFEIVKTLLNNEHIIKMLNKDVDTFILLLESSAHNRTDIFKYLLQHPNINHTFFKTSPKFVNAMNTFFRIIVLLNFKEIEEVFNEYMLTT